MAAGDAADLPEPLPEPQASPDAMGHPAGPEAAGAATAGPAEAKKVSCLDAAAQVLGADGSPMRCKELVAAMAEKGLWSSTAPTPEATLYSAILREIGKKGVASRFRKTGRGHFALNA